MLPRWGEGERTAQVVKESLGITPDELDRRFRAWLGRTSIATPSSTSPICTRPRSTTRGRPRGPRPNDAKKQVRARARALRRRAEARGRGGASPRRCGSTPSSPTRSYVKVAHGHPREELRRGRAARRQDDRRRQRRLRGAHEGGRPRRAQKDIAAEKENLEAARKLDPIQVEPLQGLYDLAHKAEGRRGELWALRAAGRARPARPQGVEAAPRPAPRARRVGGGAQGRRERDVHRRRRTRRCTASTPAPWRAPGTSSPRSTSSTARSSASPSPRTQAEIYGELGEGVRQAEGAAR